jgi:hypothetical protein
MLDLKVGIGYNLTIKQYNTMGQIKKLLDELFEEDVYTFPDDFDMDYKSIRDKQLEAEYAAYEEMLSDVR